MTIQHAGDAFMNEENPVGSYAEDLAAEIWPTTIAFFKAQLG